MESVDQKDEQYLGYQFNGGDLKEILPVMQKHFSFTLFEINGMLDWCNKKLYNNQATETSVDEKGMHHSRFNPKKFFIEENHPITIVYPESLAKKIQEFFDDESNLIKDEKQKIILWIMFYVYSESIIEPDYSECWDYNYRIFYEFVRPDMLALYKFLHDNHKNFSSDQQEYKDSPKYRMEGAWSDPYKNITLSYGKHSLTLNNMNNWFLTHLTEYLCQYLKEDDIKEVEFELKEYKNRVGAKPDHDFHRIVTQLYHFLQDETPYHDPEGKTTDKICTFITKFLEVLGFLTIVPDDDEFNIKKEEKKRSKILSTWVNNIRTNIKYNLEREKERGAYKSKKQEFFEKASIQPESNEEEEGKTLMEIWNPKYW